MHNFLKNAGFNDGHHHQGGIPELTVPDWWRLYYLDDETFPGIGETPDTPPAYRPESVVWPRWQAPDHEKELYFREPMLSDQEDHCLKVFKAWAPVYFAVVQTVTGLTPGARYKFTAWVFPDIVERYEGGQKVRPTDQWCAEARAGWCEVGTPWPRGQDQGGGEGVDWGPDGGWHNVANGKLEIGAYAPVTVEVVAPASGEVDVMVECKAKWGFENNWFFDAFTMEALNGPEPPPTGEIDVRAHPDPAPTGSRVTIQARHEEGLTGITAEIVQSDGTPLGRDYEGHHLEGNLHVWTWLTDPADVPGTCDVAVTDGEKVGFASFDVMPGALLGHNKLGPHVTRAVSRIKEWAAAGPAVLKIVGTPEQGDWWLASEAHPNTLVIGRAVSPFDAQSQRARGLTPFEAAVEFIDSQIGAYDEGRDHGIVYWEGHNEPQFDADGLLWYSDFERERMKQMAAMGLKCVIGSFSVGKLDLADWEYFLGALFAAEDYEAILGLHEYSCPWMWWMTGDHQIDPGEDQGDEGWATLRYRKVLRQWLDPLQIRVPVAITECGLDPLVNPKPPLDGASGAWRNLCDFWADNDGRSDCARYYWEQLDWYQHELEKDDLVVGATIFTHGAYPQWKDFDVADSPVEDLAIADALARPAVPFEYPEPVEPEPEPCDCRGKPRIQYERTVVLLPPDATWLWAAAVAAVTWDDRRFTISGSADDAGIGDLDARDVVALNPAAWPGDLAAFFETHYPGVNYRGVVASNPFDAAVSLFPPALFNEYALSQRDPRWADKDFGEGVGGGTIGEEGCLLTCLAMMLRHAYVAMVTPDALDRLLVLARAPYDADDSLVDWGAAVAMFEAFDAWKKLNRPFNGATLKGYIENGWLVTLRIESGSAALPYHFVYLEAVTNTGLRVVDPWTGQSREISDGDVTGIRAAHLRYHEPEPPPPAHPLRGVHDKDGGRWMGDNDLDGWCVVLQYGTSGGAVDVRDLVGAGVNVVVRLSYSYARRDGGLGTMPVDPGQLALYEDSCVQTVERTLAPLSDDERARVFFIYCNEMNNPSEQPVDGIVTPGFYIASYNRVAARLPAGCQFGPGAIDPFNAEMQEWGDWRVTWKWVLDSIDRAAIYPVHAYCHDSDLARIWSTQEFGDAPLNGVVNGTPVYYDLRVAESQIAVLPVRFAGVPVVVTETSHFRRADGALGWETDERAYNWVMEAYDYFASIGVAGACLYRWGNPVDSDHPMWGFGGNGYVLDALKEVGE